MTPTTPPAVSEAMREAVARVVDPVAWHDFDRFGRDNMRTARDRRVSLLTADRLLKSGPLASEIARLTGEREAARAKAENADLIAKNEWLRSEGLVERLRTAEADLTRMRAENARLRDALEPFAKANAMDPPESWRLNDWLPAVTGARAALSNPEQTDA